MMAFLNMFLQVGGADQWGNITAGLEMIRKVAGAVRLGCCRLVLPFAASSVVPTISPGCHGSDRSLASYTVRRKVWQKCRKRSVDQRRPNLQRACELCVRAHTSTTICLIVAPMFPQYALYQHFLHTPDSELDNLLRLFTTLSEDDMQALMAEHEQMPGKRVAQQALAREITAAVRGESAVARAEAVRLRCLF